MDETEQSIVNVKYEISAEVGVNDLNRLSQRIASIMSEIANLDYVSGVTYRREN